MKNHKKIRDMYNFIFSLAYLAVTIALILLIGGGNLSMGPFEFIIFSLATLRLTRLFVYDAITQFIRDWFLDVRPEGDDFSRQKFDSGFKRAVSDVLLCPWCFSIWAATALIFLMAIPGMIFLIYILALSAVASAVQILVNLVGWHAEGKKMDVTKKSSN